MLILATVSRGTDNSCHLKISDPPTAAPFGFDSGDWAPVARGETQPPNRASSSCVGRRPCGVSLSTKPGTSCDSCAVTSCSDKPVFSDKALIRDGPSADPSEPG